MFTEFTNSADPYVSAWSLWSTKERILALENPWVTTDILAPTGSYLAYHALVPLAGVVLTPLTAIVGPAMTVNVTRLLIPVLDAYVVYRLVRRLGFGGVAPYVSGALYGFSSVIVWRADIHLNFAVGSLMLPLAVLFAARYVQRRAMLDAAGMGAVVGTTMLVDPTAALFAAIGAGTYLLAALIHTRHLAPADLKAGAVALGVAVLIALPQVAMMARQREVEEYSTSLDILAISWKTYATSVLALFSPSPQLRVHPFDLDGMMTSGANGEGISAYGWGLLLLGAAGVALVRRRWLVAWAAGLWLAASVFALGPGLTLVDEPLLPLPIERYGQELSGLMPYTWLVHLPGFGDARFPARFVLLGLLPLAVLGGLGAEALRTRGSVVAKCVLGVAATLGLLEAGWSMGVDGRELDYRWTLKPRVPLERGAVYDPIERDHSGSIVVDVPVSFQSGIAGAGTFAFTEPMLRATEHGHPISNGYVSRLDYDTVIAQQYNPFYADLLAIQTAGSAEGEKPKLDPHGARLALKAMNVGWVVVWPDNGSLPISRVRGYLRRTGFREAGADGPVLLFRRESTGS
jgi:hypothetical protein